MWIWKLSVSVKQRLSNYNLKVGELRPHLVRSVLGVGDFHPMPSTNAQLKISYAIAVVNGGCQIPSTDISTVSKQSGTGFVGILDAGRERPWFVTLQLQGISVRFKIDTGAEVTVIPEPVFKRIRNANLMHSDRILCGPAKNALHVIRQFNATLKHRSGVTSEEVYVVRGLQTPLIGLPAIKALGLVVRVCATESGDYATRILNMQLS